ncbi:MAG TPA: hypothetical protein VGK02_00420 [Candidatus Aquicultor sp.]|jgi:hypothetical protein
MRLKPFAQPEPTGAPDVPPALRKQTSTSKLLILRIWLRRILKSRRNKIILAGAAVVLIVGIAYGAQTATKYKSPAEIKDEQTIVNTAVNGWAVKYTATMEANQKKVNEYRMTLPQYYSNDKGELTVQQRLITAFLDTKIENGQEPWMYQNYYTDNNQAVVDFRVTGFKLDSIKIGSTTATVKGRIEYFISRRQLSQVYPSDSAAVCKWDFVKKGNKWLIEDETLVTSGAAADPTVGQGSGQNTQQ